MSASVTIQAVSHHQVRVLPPRHLVVENTGIRCPHVRLEATVHHPDLTPVEVEGLDIGVSNPSSEAGLFERTCNSTHRGLRG